MKPADWIACGVLALLFLFEGPGWANDFNVQCPGAPAAPTTSPFVYTHTTIQQAANDASAASVSGPHVITVYGNCVEPQVNVSSVDRLRMQGEPGVGASLTKTGGGGTPALNVSNSRRFRLQKMTVAVPAGEPANSAVNVSNSEAVLIDCDLQNAGAGFGLSVRHSLVQLTNCPVHHSLNGGIRADKSSLTLTNSPVENNGNGIGGGILLIESSLWMDSLSAVRNNAGTGISALQMSSVLFPAGPGTGPPVPPGLFIEGNTMNGVSLEEGSALTGSATIRNNGSVGTYGAEGIRAFNNSTIRFFGLIENNFGTGIQLYGSSSAILASGLTIRQNHGGISALEDSAVTMDAGAQVTQNTDGGISLADNSAAIITGANIYNNTGGSGHGIRATNGSSLTLLRSLVTGNSGIGVRLEDNSTLVAQYATIGNNAGDGIQALRNSGVTLDQSQVNDNFGRGLFLESNSQATITTRPSFFGTTMVNNNHSAGVQARIGSSLNFNKVQIDHTTGVGLSLEINSSANLSGLTVTNNSGNGLQALNGSSASLANVQINTNTGNALVARTHSSVTASNITISSNTGDGVNAGSGSDVRLIAAQITNNTRHGMFLEVNSSASTLSGSITGNTGDGLHLETGSGVQFVVPTPPQTATSVTGNLEDSSECTDSQSWVSGDSSGLAKPIKCTILK
ncbi:MAG: right-handed parallel beta-helix repeat-containing protein [Acidobacteria bacterium]|nr:right-handed parallel beta-helix repeat-containing protein [Acidobacteriota bacterium]